MTRRAILLTRAPNLGRMLVGELEGDGDRGRCVGRTRDRAGHDSLTVDRCRRRSPLPHLIPPRDSRANPPAGGREYAGGDLAPPARRAIRVADCPVGGHGGPDPTPATRHAASADDKAGVADHGGGGPPDGRPPWKHGAVWVCFTCDEEIGRGVDHTTSNGPAAACYTLRPCRDHRRGDVFRRPGDRHDSRQEHPPFDCQGQDGQRGPPAISWLASRDRLCLR